MKNVSKLMVGTDVAVADGSAPAGGRRVTRLGVGSRRWARAAVAALASCVVLLASGHGASAQTGSFHTKFMCYGKDRLNISLPEISNKDGYVDAAFPEIWVKASGVWRTWFNGSPVYDNDVRSVGGGYVGGPETYPTPVWRDFGTNLTRTQWDYVVATGTEVAVKMWFFDGRTRAWRSEWALHYGDLGGRLVSCKTGQYQGYGWWW